MRDDKRSPTIAAATIGAAIVDCDMARVGGRDRGAAGIFKVLDCTEVTYAA